MLRRDPFDGVAPREEFRDPRVQQLDQGAGFPARLELRLQSLDIVADTTGSDERRRYYRITDEGRAVLQQWSAIWRQTRSFVDLFIEGTDS